MGAGVFTPVFFALALFFGTALASLELLWLKGPFQPLSVWPWLAALALVNFWFFLVLVSIRDSHFFLFVFPLPVIPALFLAAKAALYFGIGRAAGAPLRHPWALVFLSPILFSVAGLLFYRGFSPINPSLENLQGAIREKRNRRLEAMLWLSVKQEPTLRILVNEAIVSDNRDAARLLFRHGADPRQQYWLRNASEPMLWLLTKWMLDRGLKPDELDTTQGPPFETIAVSFTAAELRYCIEKGFKPAAYSQIVYEAIDEQSLGDLKVVNETLKEKIQVLLDHGADVNGDGPMRFKPLFAVLTSRLDFSPVLLFLLEKGADVNARTVNKLYPDGKPPIPEGITPLMLAVMDNRVDYVELLLKRGADPSVRDSTGHSALEYAAPLEPGDAVRRLLGATASPAAAARPKSSG